MEESNVPAHHHDEAHIRAIINRMSRAIGHFEAVKRMVENGDDCADVLIQLAAVKSAVNGIGREIFKEHISHCLVEAASAGITAEFEAMNNAIDRFMS